MLGLQSEGITRGVLPIRLPTQLEYCLGLFDPAREIDVVATEVLTRLYVMYGEEFSVAWTRPDRYSTRPKTAYFEGLTCTTRCMLFDVCCCRVW